MTFSPHRLLLALALAAVAACSPPFDVGDGGLDGDVPLDPDAGSVDAGRPDAGREDGGQPVPDAGPETCHSCHGSLRNDAPPTDTHGRSEPGLSTVGAHQAHLTVSTWHRDVRCDDCHVVPATKDAPGHLDPSPAEVVFSALSRTAQAPAAYDGGTCGSYCHGPTLGGGKQPDPTWTQGPTTQAYCGDCHGVPPPYPHPQDVGTDCSSCHPDSAPGLGFKEPARHIDGVVDVKQGCALCHGGVGDLAPFRDTTGRTTTTQRSVGAHAAHLTDSRVRKALECTECHRVPQASGEVGHVDTALPAELTFGPLATHDGGLAPAWNGATCTNSYCHGATLPGGAFTNPTWTRVDGAQAACDACHALVPPPPHPASADCHLCHPQTVPASGGLIDVAGGHHINGVLEVDTASVACGGCHGVPPRTGAHAAHYGELTVPPRATYGDTRALENYLPDGGATYLFGCGQCHPVAASKHLNGVLEVELSDLTAPAGSLKALNPGSATYVGGSCANVYCHSSGQALPTFVVTPPWASGQKLGCAGCHANPPRYLSGDAGTPQANTHLVLSKGGYEYGHFGGLMSTEVFTGNYHGGFNNSVEGAGAITCQTCHFDTVDPTNTGPSGFYYLDTTGDYRLPGGALDYGCANGGCHQAGSATAPLGQGKVRPLRHVNGRREVVFDQRTTLPAGYDGGVAVKPTQPYWMFSYGFFGSGTMYGKDLAAAAYQPATKTCTNVSCHQGVLANPPRVSAQWGGIPNGDTPGLDSSCNFCH